MSKESFIVKNRILELLEELKSLVNEQTEAIKACFQYDPEKEEALQEIDDTLFKNLDLAKVELEQLNQKELEVWEDLYLSRTFKVKQSIAEHRALKKIMDYNKQHKYH
jgi:hypothetical protein